MVFESEKFVLTNSGMYVEKGYVTEWLFKLNVMMVVPKINKVKHSSAYLIESSNLWHVDWDTLIMILCVD